MEALGVLQELTFEALEGVLGSPQGELTIGTLPIIRPLYNSITYSIICVHSQGKAETLNT